VFTIVLQAGFTVLLIDAADLWDMPPLWKAAAAAAGLFLALAFSSLAKALILTSILERPINNWRWALIWATAAALIVGAIAVRLPEWAELLFGIPAILAAYGAVIWSKGFGQDDRALFRRAKPDASS
jgi:hypothetical protein